MEDQTQNTAQKKSRKRKPTRNRSLEDSQGRGKLTVQGIEDDRDHYYHVVNDKDGRVYELQQRGFEVVDQSDRISMGECNPSEVGSGYTAIADSKEGTKAVLMRCPREFKEEDDAYRQKELDKAEEAMFRQLDEGQYGEIKTESSKRSSK